MFEIRDTHTGVSAFIETWDDLDVIRSWYADAPAEVHAVIDDLIRKARNAEYFGDEIAYLGLTLS